MEVILLKNFEGLGGVDSVVNVRAGYARNYLIPEGIVVRATVSNRKVLAEKIKQAKAKRDGLVRKAKDFVERLRSIKITMPVKSVGGSNKLFGTIMPLQISDALKKYNNIDLDSNNIVIDTPIKELGVYKVTVNVFEDISTSVDINVVSQSSL